MYAEQGRCRGCEIRETEGARIPDKAKGVKIGLFPDEDTEAGRRIVLAMAERD